ncbi:MAG: outer membrane lipid asymmetry maintenance protein MlaD [Gammaproteobacteria bacterium]
MSRRGVELLVGLFVALGIAALFMLAMQVSNLSTVSMGDTYQVTARFTNIGGLTARSPVKASGVRVGRVTDIRYDDKTHEAIVTLAIEKRFNQFPVDTAASIYTSGLLGEQYIALQPGVEDQNLKDGDKMLFTNSAMVLERLIGKFMVNKMEQ